MGEPLLSSVAQDLEILVPAHPDRHVGRPGNLAAVNYVESELLAHGWRVSSTPFQTIDGQTGDARVLVDGHAFDVWPGPYSLPFDGSGTLLAAATPAELEATDIEDAIVLLHGELAADQLLPRSFTFLDVPDHRRVYALLDQGRPRAVIGATSRGGGLAGGLYPYPLIEDGEFDIPNAYTTDVTGDALLAFVGRTVMVSIEAERLTVHARQVCGRRGPPGAPRAVVMAHVDSKGGSPGAIDNATGVAALLTVSRMLDDYAGPYQVELLPVNGEDHFANSGEHLFVAANEGRWNEITSCINMDAIGARHAGTACSLYGMSEVGRSLVHRVVRRHPSVTFGEPWYESDHSIVASHGRPAMALTSTSFRELCATVTHTERDTLELVDPGEVMRVAAFVSDLLRSLPAVGGPEA